MTDLKLVSDNDLIEEIRRRRLKINEESTRPKTTPERKVQVRTLSPIKPKSYSAPTTPILKEVNVKTYEKKTQFPRSDESIPKTYYIPSFLSSNRHPNFSKAKRFYDNPVNEVN